MNKTQDLPRPEYPRPQFKRETYWVNLNGTWDFQFDDDNIGIKEKWYTPQKENVFQNIILVPFCYQSKLSGINSNEFHDIIWYKREFRLPKNILKKKLFLNCGAIDYFCQIYINGDLVGSHEGGYTPIKLDITYFVKNENSIVIRVEDPSKNVEIPRGKQFWEKKPKLIFYPRVSGIWQTIWIEAVHPDYYIDRFKIFPNIDSSEILIEPKIIGKGSKNLRLRARVIFNEELISQAELKLDFLGSIKKKRRDKAIIKEKVNLLDKIYKTQPLNEFKFKISIPEEKLYLWSSEEPNLYDLELTIFDPKVEEEYDKVTSYFGMRKISLSDSPNQNNLIRIGGREYKSLNKLILMNNRPIYQKLFLLQGYWEESLYTPPSEGSIKKDVEFIKKFGFNGLRTHQKAFDPVFLYWCDKKGVIVWSELGNSYAFSFDSQIKFLTQYTEMVNRDFNHPSIIAWTLLNENWGVPGAEFDRKKIDYSIALYYLIKSMDPTRLIIDDDGWNHTITDICTKHFYWDTERLPKDYNEELEMKYPDDGYPSIYIKPYGYKNEPVIYSEVGGYIFDLYDKVEKHFGYGKVDSSEELLQKLILLCKEFDKRKEWIHGFCYTELYDQFQEINGLLTINREPKFPPELLKEEIDKLFY